MHTADSKLTSGLTWGLDSYFSAAWVHSVSFVDQRIEMLGMIWGSLGGLRFEPGVRAGSRAPVNQPIICACSLAVQLSHKPKKLSLAQVRQFADQVDIARLWETHLRPMLIERVPGTAGGKAVQQVSRHHMYLHLPINSRSHPPPSRLLFNT